MVLGSDLPRHQNSHQGAGPPPPPFAQPVNINNSVHSSTSVSSNGNSPSENGSPRTVANLQASSFAPPPFVPPVLSRRFSTAHQNPPPPLRRSINNHAASTNPNGVTGGWRAHQIIRVSIRRPMGIIFAPNEESGFGVRIIDLQKEGAAALTQQLSIGDVLISVNGRDCTMSNSREVSNVIAQTNGYVEMAFQRISGPDAPAAASEITDEEEKFNNSMQVSIQWQDVTSGLHGKYEGTVNQQMKPHGHGRFTADQGQSFEGEWMDGVMYEVKSSPTADATANNNAPSPAVAAAAAAISTFKRQNTSDERNNASPQSFSHNSSEQKAEDASLQNDTPRSSPSLPVQFYCLGETLRSPQHMVQLASAENTVQAVDALQNFDFAFVRRSNGEWSFCQLVERKNNDEGEDIMTFCVNELGHRKSLRPIRWSNMVRACSDGVMVRRGAFVPRGSLDNGMDCAPSF